MTLYNQVGYVAVLDGSTGDVVQADALAGVNVFVSSITVELHKGFAYIAGTAGYIGDGIEYKLNGFPQVAYGDTDMLFARMHLKTMEWKYVRTIGGSNYDQLVTSTMDKKGNWYIGAVVLSTVIHDFTKRGETLDTDDGNYGKVVAQVIKGTGDVKSFHNFGGEVESGSRSYIQDIAIGKDGLYAVGSWSHYSLGP